MGINISGNTDIISATDGSLTIQGADFTAIAAGSTAAPSISPTGDSNTGIFFPSADTVAFGEGGVEALRIDSSGNLKLSAAATSILNSSGNKILNQTGSIIQVVQTVKTDTTSFVSTNTNTFVDISGMSVSITPTSSSNKILVFYTANASQNAAATIHLRLIRGSTSIFQGDAAGNRLGSTQVWRPNSSQYAFDIGPMTGMFLDSPATTSSTTYKLQATLGVTYSGTFYLNRPYDDTNADYSGRTASSITVMEVSG